ncbi:hypothetical protein D910_05086 [Dendroctonus ponderosae]
MNIFIIVSFLVVALGTALCHHHEHYFIPHYHFKYGVHDPHTKDHKSHEEHRHHDDVVGSYTIDEPDGSKRIVEYTAGKHTGFRAIVRRIGPAHHPHGSSFYGVTHWGFGSGR